MYKKKQKIRKQKIYHSLFSSLLLMLFSLCCYFSFVLFCCLKESLSHTLSVELDTKNDDENYFKKKPTNKTSKNQADEEIFYPLTKKKLFCSSIWNFSFLYIFFFPSNKKTQTQRFSFLRNLSFCFLLFVFFINAVVFLFLSIWSGVCAYVYNFTVFFSFFSLFVIIIFFLLFRACNHTRGDEK